MSDRKHIDRLFQEHLKDLDHAPDPDVWKAIEAELNNKKKQRRVIPIWWRTAGVAALLLLFLALGISFFNTNTSAPTHTVTEQELPDSLNQTLNNTNKTPIQITDAANTSKSESEDNSISKVNNTSTVANTKSISSKPTVITKSIASTENEDTRNIASNNNKDSKSSSSNTVPSESISTSELNPKNENIGLAQKNTQKPANNSTTKQTTPTKIKDTLSIEEAIAQAETSESTPATKKWNINPNIAPVYYNAAGTGSHLDDQFVNNSKTGEINTSYGLSVGYAVTQKLKIRSGINSVKLSFNTNDVVVYEPSASAFAATPQLKHVKTPKQPDNLAMVSANNLSGINNNSFLNESTNAVINQNINYFEVPLELEYNIINKRIGLHVIGGVSTFFLNDNTVYSESNSNRSYLGEATNLNDVSFSTNLGIGVDYSFAKRFNINLEPTVKYQFNAYNQTSGSVRPYIIGVYTGFSYKF
ncbi:outer membrane beta-barrel protein [Formosa sp. A9]|uniref:outer membrane beta-barrel protein n=1 Tax=Formosa sp. A9 TaxID=3442641 RepID=UPI003EB77CA8